MSTASEMLTLYLDAEKAILQGKTFSFQGRTISYENLSEITKGREYWERRANRETNKSKLSFNFSVADLSKGP